MSNKEATLTPKGSVTFRNIGSGFNTNNIVVGGLSTLKFKKEKFNGSLQISDQTLKESTLRDCIASLDWKAKGGLTLNGKYEAGPKKYYAGATWNGTVADRSTQLKLYYTNKNNMFAGEATMGGNKKANLKFNQKQLLDAKYTFKHGNYTLEPSYSFVKEAPALSASRKFNGKDNVELSYDFKTRGPSVEWSRKPLKVAVKTTLDRGFKPRKPTVAATFENVYEF